MLVTSITGVAYADPPEEWANNPSVSPLHVLLVMAVIPIGLFILITLLVYIPSMTKNESYRPGQAWRGEPTWFGGPRAASRPPRAAQAIGAGGSDSSRGGASGRW